jgi:Dolichyl-phosphate-mannose-protein mannosyltransferase
MVVSSESPRERGHGGGASVWAQTRWRGAAAAPVEHKLYWTALAAVLALGTFLRLNGYLGPQISFWLDEALWAPRFVEWPLLKLGIRPIGFVWLTRQIVSAFGASELAFRFLPNLGGVLSLWLMPYVAARLLDSRPWRVLLVALFALHPGLIDLSKEFKPYSFEVLIHLSLLALYLRYLETRAVGYVYALLASLPVAFLLAYNVAFALPGILLLVLWTAFKGRQRKLVLATLLSGALTAGVVFGANHFFLSKIEKGGETESYWGKKYNLFYLAETGQSRLRWTLAASGDMAAVIGLRRDMWEDEGGLAQPFVGRLQRIDRWLWITLTLLGTVALLRRKREQALLWLLPLVTVVAVNALGKWPLGQFRTNLFACVYLFPLPVLALEMLVAARARLIAGALSALVGAHLLLGFAFGFHWGDRKGIWCQSGYSREVLATLYELRAERPRARRARLVLDLYSSKAFDYYLRLHPTFSERYRGFSKQFAVDKVSSSKLISAMERRLKQPGTVYVVAAKETSVRALDRTTVIPGRALRKRRINERVLILVADD